MATPETVPASELTRNFGGYRMRAQRRAVAVSSHGRITGYFVGPDEYEEFLRSRENRRTFPTVDLPEEQVKVIGASRMDKRHARLDIVLDRKQRSQRCRWTQRRLSEAAARARRGDNLGVAPPTPQGALLQ